jgi:hypothetical protein
MNTNEKALDASLKVLDKVNEIMDKPPLRERFNQAIDHLMTTLDGNADPEIEIGKAIITINDDNSILITPEMREDKWGIEDDFFADYIMRAELYDPANAELFLAFIKKNVRSLKMVDR